MDPADQARTRDEYIGRAEIKLSKLFTTGGAADDIRAGFKFGGGDAHGEGRIQLLEKMRLISPITFQALIGAGESFYPMYVNWLWERLVRADVFVRQFRNERGEAQLADHQIDLGKLLRHLRDGTFPNIFHLPSQLHTRYAPAVVAVDVELSNGSMARGSGFIVSMDETDRRWIFTCQHNIDPAVVDMKTMTSASGMTLSVGKPMISDRYDLAVFPLETDIRSTPLVLNDGGQVFDDVFTLGFPQVPGADSVMLGHRGEINARADLYLQKCPALIISNLVSPGSSGGPVLDREGRCLGMTIRWLEGEWGGEKARFSAALPAATLVAEFKRLKTL